MTGETMDTDQLFTEINRLHAEIARLRGHVAKLEAEKATLRDALGEIARTRKDDALIALIVEQSARNA